MCVCSRSDYFLTVLFPTIAYVHGLLFCLFSLWHPPFATFTRDYMRVNADKNKEQFSQHLCHALWWTFCLFFLVCYYLVSPRSLLLLYGLLAHSVLFQCLQALKLNAFLCPGHPLQVLKCTLVKFKACLSQPHKLQRLTSFSGPNTSLLSFGLWSIPRWYNLSNSGPPFQTHTVLHIHSQQAVAAAGTAGLQESASPRLSPRWMHHSLSSAISSTKREEHRYF